MEERRTPEDKQRVAPYDYELRTVRGHRVFFGMDGEYAWQSSANRAVLIDWLRQKDRDGGGFDIRELPDALLADYLSALPSSVPAMTFDVAHEREFIRAAFDRDFDYLDRRLAVWASEGAVGGEGRHTYAGGFLETIMDRRSLYFVGLSSAAWKKSLARGLLNAEQGKRYTSYAFVKAQRDELHAWWLQHRDDVIDVSSSNGDVDRDGRIGAK